MSDLFKRRPGPRCRLDDIRSTKRAITMYFAEIYDETTKTWKDVPAITELALALGLSSTNTLRNYANGQQEGCKPGITEAVKKAVLRIESYHEKELARSKNARINTIFLMKNLGWRDQQDIRHEGEISTVTRMELPPKRPVGSSIKGEKVSRNSRKKAAEKK